MPDSGQRVGSGPCLAGLDCDFRGNAISEQAAATTKIASKDAGRADIFVAPDLQAGSPVTK
jgi:phosphotransacetylase